MRKIKSLVLAGLFLTGWIGFSGFQAAKLVKTKINDKLSVMVPQGWIPMDGMDFTQRYPSVRAPLAAYTNLERTVDFSVNISATRWPDANMELSQRFFKASLLNMFDRVEMINEGVQEVGKKKLIFFEFESRINGNRSQEGTKDPVLRYTYIQYLVEPDRTLVFSFNCPRRLRENWQETAREIMANHKFK
jgi:hypothetical protein